MIEVEKKFRIADDKVAALIKGAEFLGEKKFVDICYDDARYSLTTSDRWLRSRDGVFELKIRFDAKDNSGMDRYYELHDEEIRDELDLEKGDLAMAIKLAGYSPFSEYATTRKKYRKEGFGIDIDSMDFGYNIGEIELMVPENQTDEATAKILAFMKKYGLESERVRGKLIEYICRYRPEHREALKKAGFRSV